MSTFWSAADVALATRLPKAGRILMIHCYFDDSGTHEGAVVVVWGGVVGSIEQFSELESRWNERLKNPMPGKPPLEKFHLFDCRERVGEFEIYTEPEAEHLQYLFRCIIVESGLMSVAFSTDSLAWNNIVTGSLRACLGGAESASFGYCAKFALEIGELNADRKMSIVFDQGRMGDAHRLLYEGARTLLPEAAKRAAATFLPVKGTPGLQAADMVANYFYRYSQRWLLDQDAEPEPHFRHLLINSAVDTYGMFSELEIRDLVKKMKTIRPDLWGEP